MNFFEKLSYYNQIFTFMLFHWIQKISNWLYNLFIKPIDNVLDMYRNHEPEEKQWIQLYCLHKNVPFNDYGWNITSYDSYEKVIMPYIYDFSTFVKNEHNLIRENPMIKLPYEYEYECCSSPLELLFVAKNEKDYVFRGYKENDVREEITFNPFPKRSHVRFLYAEYRHPDLPEPIDISISSGYYLEGNHLFTPAFIHRYLHYLNKFFIFDYDYKVTIMDHKLEEITLTYKDYIVLEQDDYKIVQQEYDDEYDDEVDDDENNSENAEEDEEESESSSTEIVENTDIQDHDDSNTTDCNKSIVSDTSTLDGEHKRLWWVF
jgi:hypothetical protein